MTMTFSPRTPHGVEDGKGQGGLATSRQYGNALLGVRYQVQEEVSMKPTINCDVFCTMLEQKTNYIVKCTSARMTSYHHARSIAISNRQKVQELCCCRENRNATIKVN